MGSQSFTDFDILRSNQSEYVTIFCRDPSTEELTDVAGTSTFNLINISDDSTEVTDTFTAGGGTVVVHPSTGIYQYQLDTSTYSEEYLCTFRCVLAGEVMNNNIFVKSVSSKYYAYAAQLRVMVDKARKSVNDEIANMDKSSYAPSVNLFYGYDDKHLIYYLERGVQVINAVPPYTALTVDTFPFSQYGSTLIMAATIAALESQGILGIDQDYNFSLGGNSFVIDHFTKINSFLSTLIGDFSKSVVSFKAQYRSKGTVLYQWMPGGVRSQRLLNALPSSFYSRMYSAAMV